jgi:hypothetical protein
MSKHSIALPFSKDEMEAELREILFIQASQIAHVSSEKVALEFIGFQYDFSPVCGPDKSDFDRVDLARFAAKSYLNEAYDYAFQVGKCWGYSEYENHNVVAFTEGVTPAAAYGDPSPFLSSDSKCAHVVDMAIGRWNLETGNDLTIRQLALLADMKEGAVRNSLSTDKIKTHGKPVSIAADIALEWLKKRKGFTPTRVEENNQAFWVTHTRSLLTAGRLAPGMRAILEDLKLTPEAAAEKAGVPFDSVRRLLADTHDCDQIEDFQRIGAALDLDVPYFVGQAVEAALRRAA